jgi:hypothetical protein
MSLLAPAALASGAGIPETGAPHTGTALSARSDRLAAGPVSIRVVSVSPLVPRPTTGLRRLRITLALSNQTDEPLQHVSITALRGMPISYQAALDNELADPAPPSSGITIQPLHPITANLPVAGSSVPVVTKTFVATTGLAASAGLCLCAEHAVYPVWFTAAGVRNGVSGVLGQTETFVPSFYRRPPPVHVSWVWPLIDRPHRILGSSQFTDDSLATSVSTGRLSRCLQVLEQVAPTVPVTVVIDPELLDELQIMAGGHYTYRAASGKSVPGTGSAAAAAWLARLQAVLKNNPQVSVALTPEADPDIEALTRAHLTWTSTLSATVQHRVLTALGGATPTSTFAWPPGGIISRPTLRTLRSAGVTSLLLSDQSVQRQTLTTGAPLTLARLPNGGHPVLSALTSPALSRYTARAVGSQPAPAALPTLMAELAVRLGQQPPLAGQQVVLAAPRSVDPSVPQAVQTILQTSSSFITRPANLLNVLAAAGTPPFDSPPTAVPTQLRPGQLATAGLPPVSTAVARKVIGMFASLRAMFSGSAAAERFVAQLPEAVQRIESAAWRRGSGLGGRPLGVKFARKLRADAHHLFSGVQIVRPASGSYTLPSANSSLLITVQNRLPYPVKVRVIIRTRNGAPGLTAHRLAPQVVDASSKTTLHVPTQVQRSGNIAVVARLQTPNGRWLGRRVPLSVHSTVLGLIGVIITIVAAAVLLLALLVRFVRRLRARGRPGPTRPWSPRGSGGHSSADESAGGGAGSVPSRTPAVSPAGE